MDINSKVKRLATKMKLKPGFENEYQKRHNEIWPELKKMFKDAGISDYAIFLDEETNNLFAVRKISSEKQLDLRAQEIVRKWWDYMADIMETNHDNSPIVVNLKEVFYME